MERRLRAAREKEGSLGAMVETPCSVSEPDELSRRAAIALEEVESQRVALERARKRVEEQAVKLEKYVTLRSAAKYVEKLTADCLVSYNSRRRGDSRVRSASTGALDTKKVPVRGSIRRARSAERQWYYPDAPHLMNLGDWYYSLDVPVVGDSVLVSCLLRGLSCDEFWLIVVVSTYQQECQDSRQMWLEFSREINAGKLTEYECRCSVLDLTTATSETREKLVMWLDLDIFDLPQLRVLRGRDRYVYNGEVSVEAVGRFLAHLPSPVPIDIPPASQRAIGWWSLHDEGLERILKSL